MADPNAACDLLFVTVGGQADTPTQACLRWAARQVVLLHSEGEKGTRNKAIETARRLGLGAGDCELRGIEDGKDPKCLYREVWLRLEKERGQQPSVMVDLTGGYKTMSAAAAAVGFLIPGARVSYVDTRQERLHGDQFWLETTVDVLTNPIEVFGDLDRRTATLLLKQHRFGPAALAWRSLADRTRRRSDAWRAGLAEGLNQAECLSLQPAANTLRRMRDDISKESHLEASAGKDPLASAPALAWLDARADGLARVAEIAGKGDPTQEHASLSKPAMLDLIAMLLGLARRRLDGGEADLAALYAYRASEATVQRRLTMRGYTVQDFDWERALNEAGAAEAPHRDRLLRRLQQVKEGAPLPALRPQVDRGLGLGILAHLLKDPLFDAKEVVVLQGIGKARNRSILAHGIDQIDGESARKLVDSAFEVFNRLLESDPDGPTSDLAHWKAALPPL